MLSHFFIDRPIFASVLSIAIIIAGLVGRARLPIEMFPDTAPPTVQVTANYPGANAKDVAENVATPIETEVNGVENMIYMFSKSTNDGQMALDVTFKPGTNLDMAQVLVQNRVSIAQAKLPDEVKRQGVKTKKRSPQILLLINLISEKEKDPKTGKEIIDPKTGKAKFKYDIIYQSNYATLNIKDLLARIPGAGDVSVIGPREYSMRVWLDPQKVADKGLTATDIVNKLRSENVQVPAGQVGQPPVPIGMAFQLPINVEGKLTTEEQFGNVVIKTSAQGQIVHLREVVRAEKGIELAAKNYDLNTNLDWAPSCPIAIYLLPGANALKTAEAARKIMKELKERFPPGLDYAIVYDTTVFVDESIKEVISTLILAIILVFVVVFVFLQNWRTTIIPMVAVPVSLIGTFFVMAILGFSLNNLSLFGLVLAIGIVVDDAIVVVENTERYLAMGFSPKESAKKAMTEIFGALIATTLVVCAVFVPTAALAGITGAFYKQFALTIAGSTLISTFNALTLSPALCALLLKPPSAEGAAKEKKKPLPMVGAVLVGGFFAAYFLTDHVASLLGQEPSWILRGILFATGALFGAFLLNFLLSWFFKLFNLAFDRSQSGYGWAVGSLLRVGVIAMLVYGGLLGLTYVSATAVPAGFIPNQDKGYLLVHAQLPDGASLERTDRLFEKLDDIFLGKRNADGKREGGIDGIAHTIGMPGNSILTSTVTSNVGGMYLILEPFSKRRTDRQLYADNIAAKVRKTLNKEILSAATAVFGAPPVDGLGSTGGFKLQVQSRAGFVPRALEGAVRNLAVKGNSQPELVGLFSSYTASQPQIRVTVDREMAERRNVPINEIFDSLGIYFGSGYVNDFTKFGRNWQVMAQADQHFRNKVEDIGQVQVRNRQGKMIRLSSFVDIDYDTGPPVVNRFNMFYSADLQGAPAPGNSSGQAISLMNRLAKKELPNTMSSEWTELSYQEIEAGKDPLSPFIFPLCVLAVFLILAAQYESWTLPLSIILIVPMSILCAMTGLIIAGMDNNIFTQIGLVVLIALAAKNAILVVEFAKQKQDEGLDRFNASLQAARLRLRPILMTAFSFILGVIPLIVATGAGAEMRVALGTCVFAGMLGVTVFGLFLTPVFYLVVRWLDEVSPKAAARPASAPTSGEISEERQPAAQTQVMRPVQSPAASETQIMKPVPPVQTAKYPAVSTDGEERESETDSPPEEKDKKKTD